MDTWKIECSIKTRSGRCALDLVRSPCPLDGSVARCCGDEGRQVLGRLLMQPDDAHWPRRVAAWQAGTPAATPDPEVRSTSMQKPGVQVPRRAQRAAGGRVVLQD